MLKVLYDHQIFQLQKFGGISRYFYEILKTSLDDENISCSLSLLHSYNDYIRNRDVSKHWSCGENFSFRGKERLRNIININHTKKMIRDCDIFHPTFYDDYYFDLLDGKKKVVVTVYDMINEKFPQCFKGNDRVPAIKKKIIESADKVLAISESTKADILEYCNISEKKIDVTYLATSLGAEADIELSDLPQNYILFVGKRGAYKNFENFYSAIKTFLSRDGLCLICAGGGSFSEEEKLRFKKDKTVENIYYYEVSDNKVLKALYKGARLFVFPSLYEGFGIPVLEAMSVGCPVALSSASSFPEVAGGAGIYFCPDSIEDIEEKIRNYLFSSRDVRVDQNKCLEQSQKFSWQKAFMDTKKSYLSL